MYGVHLVHLGPTSHFSILVRFPQGAIKFETSKVFVTVVEVLLLLVQQLQKQ